MSLIEYLQSIVLLQFVVYNDKSHIIVYNSKCKGAVALQQIPLSYNSKEKIQMNTITNAQMNKLVNLYAQLGEELPQVAEKFTKDMASAKITELEGKLKKLSVFYCSKEELINLRNVLNNSLLFLMFKSEVLDVIPEHFIESLEQDSLVLDALELKNSQGKSHISYNGETKELLPLLSKARERITKRNRIMEVHKALASKINEPNDVLTCLIDKDSYRKFMSNHALEIKYWNENKATVEQQKLIRNLTIQATGTNENTDYIYSLTKAQASKMIDRLTFERGLNFRGVERETEQLYKQYSKPNEEFYQGENPNENPEETQWEKMIISLSYHSGYMIECDYNDFNMLKEVVKMLVPQIGMNKISDTILNFLALDKLQIEFLGLQFSDYRINKMQNEKQQALETLKNLLEMGMVNKEDVALLIK